MERMIRLALPCFLTHRALIVPTLSLSPINFFVFTRGLLARVCVCALVIHPSRFRFPWVA
jgi:hypothetical protein